MTAAQRNPTILLLTTARSFFCFELLFDDSQVMCWIPTVLQQFLKKSWNKNGLPRALLDLLTVSMPMIFQIVGC